MLKLGDKYQHVLADILRRFKNVSVHSVGEWVDGPDGLRELDVVIEVHAVGRTHRILFECKDYRRSRRIEIGIVDAFESKLRDLGFPRGILCSNGDFSDPARLKAARTGIGLIAALSGSEYRVSEYLECRDVYYQETSSYDITLLGPHVDHLDLVSLRLRDGVKLSDLVRFGGRLAAGIFPIVKGRTSFQISFEAFGPIELEIPNSTISKVVFHLDLKGAWLGRKSWIQGDNAIYDWMRRLVHPAGQGQISFDPGFFTGVEYWIPHSKLMTKNGHFLGPLISAGVNNFPRPEADEATLGKLVTLEMIRPLSELDERVTSSISRGAYKALVKPR